MNPANFASARLALFGLALLLASCGSGRLLRTGRGPEDLVRVRLPQGDAVLTGTVERWWPRWLAPQARGRLELLVPGPGERFQTVYSAPRFSYGGTRGFRPVGMDVVAHSQVPGLTGKQLVYVINARPQADPKRCAVEVFEVKPDASLHHLGALPATTLIASANGLAATSDGCVYVSNFAKFSTREHEPSAVLDGQPARGGVANTIVCFQPSADGAGPFRGTWRVVATGFNGVNGLAVTRDEQHLLANSFHARSIDAFARKQGTGALRGPAIRVAENLRFSPDNLKRQQDGSLIAAGVKHTCGTILYFLTGGLTPCDGEGARFEWRVKEKAETGHERLTLGNDTGGPSGAIQIAQDLYISHILRSGIRRVEMTPGQ